MTKGSYFCRPVLIALAAAVLHGCATIPPGNSTCAAEASGATTARFGGDWATNYGPMKLQQTGSSVQGTYTDNLTGGTQGTLYGTVSGAALAFHWIEGQLAGDARFVMCADGASFAGAYANYPWSGTLVRGSAPVEAEPPPEPKLRSADAPEAEKPWWKQDAEGKKP
jgi:hypothetical protein